jgi:hypothetical protein
VTDYLAQADGIDISPVADGYVVYDQAGDAVHYLNHTAALVLELCTGRNTADGIASILEQSFPDAQGVRACVADCIGTLMARGLVRPVTAAPAKPVPSQPVPPQPVPPQSGAGPAVPAQPAPAR